MIKAVILDMDGVMFDTERLFVESAMKAAKKFNYDVPIELLVSIIGERKDVANETLYENLGKDIDVLAFRDECKKIMEQDMKENGTRVKKGLFELIDFLKENNIKLGVASSSTKQEVDIRLKYSGLDISKIDSIICGFMIENPKPDPEIYIKSCKQLNVSPNEAIAVEDSDFGIMAGANAGLKAILITDVKEPSKKVMNMAYKELNSLLEVIDLIKENVK